MSSLTNFKSILLRYHVLGSLGSCTTRFFRKRKLALAGLILTSMVILVFVSHDIQLSLMEHISLKTFIVRMILQSQNLDGNSSMYGSFFNSSWATMQSIDILNTLDAVSSINATAVMQFLTGPDQIGPADMPMKYEPQYNIESAFVITHTASALGRLNELPSTLIEEIRETIIARQNSTSMEIDIWDMNRMFLLETARLLNQKQYVNLTLQKEHVLKTIAERIWYGNLFGVYFYIKALEEICLMESGFSYIRYQMPDVTRSMVEFYILSLWDDTRYGFYEDLTYSNPKYYETSLTATYMAIYSYIDLSGEPRHSERDALGDKVGFGYEKLLAFLTKCQNRYGLFFDQPWQVDDRVTSLQIWATYSAVMLLNKIGRMDFLDQTVRWPSQPTFIESLNDQFRK